MNPPANQHYGRDGRRPRKLVLCFDGTGNKFRGDDSDSNILKIFRMLDRTASDQYHYYQPGIGTYVVSNNLSHTSVRARLKSWVTKARDSAIGSSFDQHVVGGYRFLMRFYSPGDEIYIFGFSRGAYIARFLAEMIDYVGLLSHGNEEMVAFAWKAFAQWSCRRGVAEEQEAEDDDANADGDDDDKTKKAGDDDAVDGEGKGDEKKVKAKGEDDKKKSKREAEKEQARKKTAQLYEFLKAFRETFSRPVRRIRFLGLFDTVNSVPRFETAWMERAVSKFPYTARTSAKVIRHAVSIDERRAKFRQDLIYQSSRAHRDKKKKKKAAEQQRADEGGKGGAPRLGHALHEMMHETYRGNHYRATAAAPAAAAGELKPPGLGIFKGDIAAATGAEKAEHVEGEDEDRGRRPSNPEEQQQHHHPVSPRLSLEHPEPFREHHSRSKSRATMRSVGSSAAPAVYHDAPSDFFHPPQPLAQYLAAADHDNHSVADIPDASDVEEGYDSEDENEQDVDEVWFAGGHGDVGGGWDVEPGGKSASHVPLAWMVREAIKAGLAFDMDKVVAMGCADAVDGGVDTRVNSPAFGSTQNGTTATNGAVQADQQQQQQQQNEQRPIIPNIRVNSSSQPPTPAVGDVEEENAKGAVGAGGEDCGVSHDSSHSDSEDPGGGDRKHGVFHNMICHAHTARIHDSLSWDCGMSWGSVLTWRLMEYMPFRRMDLQPDGSWRPIRWPLPCGEVRDMPMDARVHGSVVRRMRADEKYRPGNLIVGGGGRGMRIAPAAHGMGEWVCVANEGDPIGEVWVRKTKEEVHEASKEDPHDVSKEEATNMNGQGEVDALG